MAAKLLNKDSKISLGVGIEILNSANVWNENRMYVNFLVRFKSEKKKDTICLIFTQRELEIFFEKAFCRFKNGEKKSIIQDFDEKCGVLFTINFGQRVGFIGNLDYKGEIRCVYIAKRFIARALERAKKRPENATKLSSFKKFWNKIFDY